jgi:glyoxylase-like metal-dependent hydrolase (beta-lactamase superfamily II)
VVPATPPIFDFCGPGGKIVPRVHVLGPSRHGATQGGYSRAYLFEDGAHLTLVDTLWSDDAHVILQYLWKIGRRPEEITDIVITHAHRSHLGGLATMKLLSPRAEIHSHADEALIIEGRASATKIPLRPLQPWQLMGFRIASQLGLQPHVRCKVDDDTLVEKSKVGSLEVMHLPGHTSGNLALWWEDGAVIAAADTIMTWPSFSAGWPGFNRDETEFARSLERVVARKPKVVCTGHGNPICGPGTEESIATLVR